MRVFLKYSLATLLPARQFETKTKTPKNKKLIAG